VLGIEEGLLPLSLLLATEDGAGVDIDAGAPTPFSSMMLMGSESVVVPALVTRRVYVPPTASSSSSTFQVNVEGGVRSS
jgi:hypothetical protein